MLFAELPTGRRRQVMSAIAHYIAGVLDREAMVEIDGVKKNPPPVGVTHVS